MLGMMLSELAKVDEWLDGYVSQEYRDQPLAQDWARISKVIEELGEAINELILLTGQNPRKARTEDDTQLLNELADVVLTGMLAMLHFTKSDVRVGGILIDKTQAIGVRMVKAKANPNRHYTHPDTCKPAVTWNNPHDLCPECGIRWCERSPLCPRGTYDRHPR